MTLRENGWRRALVAGALLAWSFAPVPAAAVTPPTFTTLSAPLATTAEDTTVGITFDDVEAAGDASDAEGPIAAYRVTTVTAGSLLLGADEAGAAAFEPGTNERIDAATSAFWLPDPDADGTFDAFELVAVDADGNESSPPVTATVTVTAVNDDPLAVQPLPSRVVVMEGAATEISLGSVEIVDVDAGAAAVTLTISTTAGGVLDVLPGVGLTVAGSPGTTVSLTGSVAAVDGHLDVMSNIRYTAPAGTTGAAADTLSVTITDNGNTGTGGGAVIALGTVAVDVAGVNDAPVVSSVEPLPLTYTEGDPPVAITATLDVSDPDDTVLEGATVTIVAGFVPTEDVLAFADTSHITGSWDGTTGTLTLVGAASLDTYVTALRSVTYENPGDAPTAGTRTVGFTADDGDATSVAATRSLVVVAVNDDPVDLGPGVVGPIAATEDEPAPLDLAGIQLADADAGAGALTLAVAATAGGTVAAPASGWPLVAVSGSGSATLSLDGTTDALNAALAAGGVTVTGPPDASGEAAETVLVSVRDNGNTGVGGGLDVVLATVDVDIAPVDDAPRLSGIETTELVHDTGETTVTETLVVTDVDSATLTGAEVTITTNHAPGQDQLVFTDTGTITGTFDPASGRLELRGTDTVAAYQAALRSVRYRNRSAAPSLLPRTITFTASDPTATSEPAVRVLRIGQGETTTPAGSVVVTINLSGDAADGIEVTITVLDDGTVLVDIHDAPDAPITPQAGLAGYWLLESDGTVHPFGTDARHYGDALLDDGVTAIALASTPSGRGYLVLDSAGTVHARGDASHHGSLTDTAVALAPGERVTTLSVTPSGRGYWIFTSLGRAIAFGDAPHLGDLVSLGITPVGDVISSVATPDGRGYYLLGTDGGVFTFGTASFAGSIPGLGIELDCDIVGLVPDPAGAGYWLVACDGGVFSFGGAPFVGSVPGILPAGTVLAAPVTAMVPFGNGYLMVATDGGAFNFATDRAFLGSLGASPPDTPVVAIAVAGTT